MRIACPPAGVHGRLWGRSEGSPTRGVTGSLNGFGLMDHPSLPILSGQGVLSSSLYLLVLLPAYFNIPLPAEMLNVLLSPTEVALRVMAGIPSSGQNPLCLLSTAEHPVLCASLDLVLLAPRCPASALRNAGCSGGHVLVILTCSPTIPCLQPYRTPSAAL